MAHVQTHRAIGRKKQLPGPQAHVLAQERDQVVQPPVLDRLRGVAYDLGVVELDALAQQAHETDFDVADVYVGKSYGDRQMQHQGDDWVPQKFTCRYFWRSGVSPSLGETFTALASTAAVTPTNMSGSSVAGCVMSAATTSRLDPAGPVRPPYAANSMLKQQPFGAAIAMASKRMHAIRTESTRAPAAAWLCLRPEPVHAPPAPLITAPVLANPAPQQVISMVIDGWPSLWHQYEACRRPEGRMFCPTCTTRLPTPPVAPDTSTTPPCGPLPALPLLPVLPGRPDIALSPNSGKMTDFCSCASAGRGIGLRVPHHRRSCSTWRWRVADHTSVEPPVSADRILAGWLAMVDSTSPGLGGLLKKATVRTKRPTSQDLRSSPAVSSRVQQSSLHKTAEVVIRRAAQSWCLNAWTTGCAADLLLPAQ